MANMKKLATKSIRRRHGIRGFSMIELLVAISIMGLMASLAVIGFGGSRETADDQKDKRNAQQIAMVAAMADAAGAKFLVPDNKKASIENLCQGCSPSNGAFKNRIFRVSPMEEPEIMGAMRFLALNASGLQYRLDKSN